LAKEPRSEHYFTPIKRLLMVFILSVFLGCFILWRIDNPRMETYRTKLMDSIIPNLEWATKPVTAVVLFAKEIKSYDLLYKQNRELRAELQKMKSWKEAALQLEQENARLLDLNKLKLNPKLTYISSVVIADSGSPFHQSILVNVGKKDGVKDGWAAMDGLGIVGRIAGVGENSSRVILLTDISSRIPAIIMPSGQPAFVTGDNSNAPIVDFLGNPNLVSPGDRVVTSSINDILPADLLIGKLALDSEKRIRVRLAADYSRLEFLRVLRTFETEKIIGAGEPVLSKIEFKKGIEK